MLLETQLDAIYMHMSTLSYDLNHMSPAVLFIYDIFGH